MNSGLYIIEGGGFSVSGNASVTGSGVTIFNAGSKYPTTGGTYGSISLSGNGNVTLSPPTTGTYAGVVIFQPADNTKALSISGNASSVTGEIYAPAAQLNESGNGQLNASIVVDTMTISGNGIADAVVLNASGAAVAFTPAQIATASGTSAGSSSIGALSPDASLATTSATGRRRRYPAVSVVDRFRQDLHTGSHPGKTPEGTGGGLGPVRDDLRRRVCSAPASQGFGPAPDEVTLEA